MDNKARQTAHRWMMIILVVIIAIFLRVFWKLIQFHLFPN